MIFIKKITAIMLSAILIISMAYTLSAELNDESAKVPFNELVYQNETEYRGEGMVIAVIDKGFYIENTHWALTDDNTAKITESTLNSLKNELNAKKFNYHNAKIPFVYNYMTNNSIVETDDIHGTHIAGIIGANDVISETGFRGIVPEAQMLFMSVFSDDGISDTAGICAAIEDAITLGADVINLSLGIVGGLENGYPFDPELAETLNMAEEAGIMVVCAAGNSGSNYKGSRYSMEYNMNLPLVSIIDNGTIAAPAIIESTIAVGSTASDYSLYYNYITLSDTESTKIKFTDTTATELPELGGSFTELFDGKTLEYVVIPGLGSEEDFDGIDVNGKLALIKRGELNFTDKLLNAESAGAIGAIIYNNIPKAGADTNMIIEGANIPAIFISMEDGLLMADVSTIDKSVFIEDGLSEYFMIQNQNTPLALSSIGPTPNLRLKPDVMAIGNDILSLGENGEMARLTGSSMSAACVSGITTMLKQYLRANDMPENSSFIRALIINSALPASSENVLFSPRIQGGGNINFDSLINTKVLITDGNETLKAKIELGDKLSKSFKIDYTLTNLTDTDQKINLKAALLTDNYLPFVDESDTLTYFISEVNAPVKNGSVYADTRYTNINIYSSGYSDYIIDLKAGETRDLTLSVILSDSFIKENSKIFTNGFFIDGFIIAEVIGTDSVSSIPFMGFYGDWANLQAIENTSYDNNLTYFDMTFMYTYIDYGGMMLEWQLGRNFINYEVMPQTKYISFSPNFDFLADDLYLSLALLRPCLLKYLALTDSDGQIIDVLDEPVLLQKSISTADNFNIISLLVWTGDDGVNPLYIYPDGEYYLTIIVQPLYGEADEQTLVIPFTLDTQSPELLSYEITENEESYRLVIECSDNHYIQAATFYDTYNGIYLDIPYTIDGEINETVTFEVNLEEFIDAETHYLYIDLYDYAFNSSTHKIDLSSITGG